jgi:hypothetical protein
MWHLCLGELDRIAHDGGYWNAHEAYKGLEVTYANVQLMVNIGASIYAEEI